MISRSVPLLAVLLLSACASAPPAGEQNAVATKAVYVVEPVDAKAGPATKPDPNAGHRIFWFVGGR
jgi:hypothetical protein